MSALPADAYDGYYGVSAATMYREWVLLAAPTGDGPMLCEQPAAARLPFGGVFLTQAIAAWRAVSWLLGV